MCVISFFQVDCSPCVSPVWFERITAHVCHSFLSSGLQSMCLSRVSPERITIHIRVSLVYFEQITVHVCVASLDRADYSPYVCH